MKKKQGVIGVICLFAVWLVCFGGTARADVVINEVMASNGYYESGHAWDWVELYNNGNRTENLSGWGFTDSKKDLYKFTFP
ncbi:MAG: lamin tail domain-containing protein, partial [Clostridia bacterium]|nr:lamin tail domain-containing protein [Clostridia bacterium]